MAYFPLFVDLQGRECLAVGGGHVALRKVKTLLEYGAHVTVVSPTVLEEFRTLDVEVRLREYETDDLLGVFLVVTATDDARLNRSVLEACKARNVLCNSATDTSDNGYVFPATARSNGITVGVSTSGSSPYVSRLVRSDVQERVLPRYGEVVALSSGWRRLAEERLPDAASRGRAVRHLIDYALERGVPSEDRILQIIDRYR